MQKIFIVRASQKDLAKKLSELSQKGLKIVSVLRGSEWGRIGFSYRWTVVVDIPDTADINEAEYQIDQMINDLTTSSIGKAVVLFFAVLASFALLGVILYFGIRCAI